MMVQSYRRSLQEFSESPVMSRCKSLSSSNLLTGAPQSITEWLTLWEKDPVEILLDLGFGTEEPDICTKIPPRFLSGASVAKGINIRVFLEAQKQRMDIDRPNLYERFRQLEVLDHVTSALSSLLTGISTQQTNLPDTTRNRPVVTQAKRRRIGQFLKRASRQTLLLKQGLLAPGEANLPSRKEQPCSSADTAERGTVQAYSSARVTLNCLTEGQTPRDKVASSYPTSQCSLTPSGKAWAPSHLVEKPLCLSPASEVPAKDRPRKKPLLLVAHTLKKVANLNCKLPNSFEMEEIQSLEDETLYGNAPDIALADVMVTRTSSCQSDSSGFMEELPEPAGLQNVSSSGKINFLSDIHNQERALSHRTGFPTLNQDFQQEPDDCVAKVLIAACESILTVPGLMKAYSNQGEETHLRLTSENSTCQACKAEAQSFVQEMVCDEDKKEKTERKQLEKERCIEEQRPCLQGDSEDDSGSSKFDYLYFGKGHKKANVTFTELSDLNPAVINENKIRGEDECKKCWTENNIGAAHNEGAHGGSTGHVKGPWWDVEVVSKDGTLLAANEVTNRQKLCKMDADSKNTRSSPKMGVPETLQWGSAPKSGSSVSSLKVSQRHHSCLAERPGLSSSEDQETGSTEEMLGANKSEQGDTVQKGEMSSAPLKSVTVQMSSRLEFTPRAKCTGQNAPLGEFLDREDPVDFSNMLAHCSEGAPLLQSDPGALKGGVKQTTEASSQTDIPTRKPGWPPLLCSPHTHLTKSASLDSVVCGKYRSWYGGEASGTRGVQGNHCCHCCCCHGCCPWTFPVAVSPQCPVGCCSNHASAEMHLLETLVPLQDTATHNLAPCTLNEIEVMKSSCQRFQEKLNEIEQHLTEQQVLFSSAMPDEGREEARHLQLLRRAVRQEVAELEFQLRDQACQVRESILMQLDQLLAEQSHLFSELGLSDWKGERKAQNKQTFPDAADTEHPRSGCSKMVLPRAPSKTTTATGSLSAPQLEAPSMQFPTRTMPESNSVKSVPQELSTGAKEIKGTPQAKRAFKAFIHNVKKSFQNSLGNDSAEGKD